MQTLCFAAISIHNERSLDESAIFILIHFRVAKSIRSPWSICPVQVHLEHLPVLDVELYVVVV